MKDMSAATKVVVGLGDRSYDILIGSGLIERAGAEIAARLPKVRAAIVTDENVASAHLAKLIDSLKAAGIASTAIVLPAGEKTKSFEALEEVVDGVIGARRAEEQALAVRRPADEQIRARMPGQSLRHSAGSRDYIDVDVSIVLPSKGDPFAVGRKERLRLDPRARCQPFGDAARSRHGPQVAGIDKGDPVLADSGFLQERGRLLRPYSERETDDDE